MTVERGIEEEDGLETQTPGQTRTSRVVLLAGLTSVALAGCGSKEGLAGPDGYDGRIEITVRPLTSSDLSEIVYGVTVRRAAPAPADLVWARSVSSATFGNGVGDITYVGPCDGSSNPHTIALVVESMRDSAGLTIPTSKYANPAPASAPIVLTQDCQSGQDVLVSIDLTILRSAEQGFFDIGVSFADIFCSAKLDCVDSLLHDPTLEARGPTAVLGFACTSGKLVDGAPEPTWLHFTDVALACEGVPTLYFDPSMSAGQHGSLGAGPAFFQTAIYRGEEQLAGLDKCYWNMGFGLRAGGERRNCRLRAQATASSASFGPSGSSPPMSIWGYVDWDVSLTDDSGRIACGQNPLNGEGSQVVTRYTPLTGAVFAHEWRCGGETPVTRNLDCSGRMEDDGIARFMPSPGGVSVSFAGARSPTYRLPEGHFANNGAECCMNPCCSPP